MLYVMSDIHGCLDVFTKNLEGIHFTLEDKLILLGDYIDYGPDSCGVLKKIYELKEKAIVLMGNHEKTFLDFLDGKLDEWFFDDKDYITIRTFLDEEQFLEVRLLVKMKKIREAILKVRSYINGNYAYLVTWLRSLPFYYETEKEIFVHAGIDEDYGELFQLSDEEIFLNKYPHTIGYFGKMIIAGHISTATIKKDKNFCGIYYDEMSHIYIDGDVLNSGILPVLLIENGHYYEFTGEKKLFIT